MKLKSGATKIKSLNKTAEENVFVLRNLKDAGCNDRMVEKFFQLRKDGKNSEQMRLLITQRKSLLRRIHENQKKIDCLDFMIFNIKQSGKKQTKNVR